MTSLDRDPKVLAHTDDPDTSHAAARAPGRATNRYCVLRLYRQPVTSYHAWLQQENYDDDCFDLAEVRRRSTDLLQMGLLKRAGYTRTILATNKEAHVLELTDAGQALLDAELAAVRSHFPPPPADLSDLADDLPF